MNVEVDALLPYGEIAVSNAAGQSVRIDDELFDWGADPDLQGLCVGATFMSIAGPLHYTFDAYKIEPVGTSSYVGFEDTACGSGLLGPADLFVGDLLITEAMVNPNLGTATDRCGWFEVYNASGLTVDLRGLELRNLQVGGRTTSHRIEESVIVADGDFVVIAKGTPASWGALGVCFAYTPAFSPDTYWGNMGLANSVSESLQVGYLDSSGSFQLLDGTAEWPVPAPVGVAWQLSSDVMNTASNDFSSSWCEATTVLGLSFDLGTPGGANTLCP